MILTHKEKFIIMMTMQEYLQRLIVSKKDKLILEKIINKFKEQL